MGKSRQTLNGVFTRICGRVGIAYHSCSSHTIHDMLLFVVPTPAKTVTAALAPPPTLKQADEGPFKGPFYPHRRNGTAGKRSQSFPELNLHRLSRDVGIHPSHASRIMNGKVRPSMQVAERIAVCMDWTMEQVAGLYQPEAKRMKKRQKVLRKAAKK